MSPQMNFWAIKFFLKFFPFILPNKKFAIKIIGCLLPNCEFLGRKAKSWQFSCIDLRFVVNRSLYGYGWLIMPFNLSQYNSINVPVSVIKWMTQSLWCKFGAEIIQYKSRWSYGTLSYLFVSEYQNCSELTCLVRLSR